MGQDNRGPEPGDVHLAIEGLPTNPYLVALCLTDAARGVWFQKAGDQVAFDPGPYAGPLVFRRDPAKASRGSLFFSPRRDETGSTLSLRLAFSDGTWTVLSVAGGPCDPALRAGPAPGADKVVARAGEDLQALAGRHGTIELTPGTYRMEKPLVLDRPIRITAAAGTATLLFRQSPSSPPWTAAIKIHAGRTTLEGFSIRFEGPIRWREDVPYGPAVIGTTDPFDPPRATPRPIAGLRFAGLDIEGPAPTGASGWVEAVRLARLQGAPGGVIEGCKLRGGMIELFDGPWKIKGNTYNGTHPGTFAPAVLSIHDPHDFEVADNRAEPVPGSGKTWRFLVLTGTGYHDRVTGNTVQGVGPRDDDAIPSMNAPEIILTEAYRLHYEGAPAAMTHEGRVLQIPDPQGDPPAVGAIVAVLSGPHAGRWSRVVQAVDRTTLVVDPPLPAAIGDVSIASGFVDTLIEGNRIDCRGGSVAAPLVLVGNQAGLQVRDNHLLGGGDAFKITASPSESPIHWGWSHNLMLDAVIENNRVEDAPRGGLIAVEQDAQVKSSAGAPTRRPASRGTFSFERGPWPGPPRPSL